MRTRGEKRIMTGNITTVIIIVVGVAALIVMMLYIIYRKKRDEEDPFESMEGEEFEKYCVELLEKQGYEEVSQTNASHDYGIDILADKDGISYAVQCKCYSNPVGIKAIQEAYAGKEYYDCMIGVVMTNQYFTRPAVEFAQKLHVLMWDGDVLSEMIRKYGGAGDNLGKIVKIDREEKAAKLEKKREEIDKESRFVTIRKKTAMAVARITVKSKVKKEKADE